MKKILLLAARLGEEEDVVAVNLKAALEHVGVGDARVETIDLLDSCYGRFDGLFGRPFLAAGEMKPKRWQNFYSRWGIGSESNGESFAGLRDSLRDVLRVSQPDVVISTCPLYGMFMGEIYREGRTRDFTLVSLVGDPVVTDSDWPHTQADFFAVLHEPAARELMSAGVPEEKIKVFGFPVQLEEKPARRSSLPELGEKGRPRILYLINTARKKAPKMLDRLLEHQEWDITACVDREIELEEMARARAATAPKRLVVIGSERGLPALLRSHHVVISRAGTGVVHEAIAAGCPLLAPKVNSRVEQANLSLLREANAGVLAEKPREICDWLERAFRDEGRLWALWRKNLGPLGRPDGAVELARFVLELAAPAVLNVPELHALPPIHGEGNGKELAVARKIIPSRLRRLPKRLLLCDLHTHTTWSDGKLGVAELVDFYGQRGFDCLCITDHLCDPKRLLGRLVNLTGLVIPPGEVGPYFESIEREKKRAWAKYDLMLMTGVEFNKDGYTPKTSTHLLGVDLKEPIDPSLGLKELIREIHAQGGLAIASHPHETKSSWGKDTLYLWEHVDEYAPLIDAWEVANRDDIFNPVGLKKLPFIASSDFHKPKHIQSWKTLLYCEKEAEAIKHCIRVNRDVSLTLYRDHRFGLEERLALPALENGEAGFEAAELAKSG